MTRDPNQLELVGRGRARHGPWERRAEQLIRRLRADGALADATAGYGDALRMAGRDRDRVESDPNEGAWARDVTRRGWDQALSRLIDAPTFGGREDDPFAALDRELDAAARRAPLRDTGRARPAE